MRGHRYNDWLGAEVGFADLGKASLSNSIGSAQWKASGLYLDGVARYGLTSQLDINGRLGLAYVDTKYSDSIAATSISKKSAGLKFGVGAGPMH